MITICVIAVSPVGVNPPTKECIEDMFYVNSDGAGFAYTINKRVYIEKGFLTLSEFENALKVLETKLSGLNPPMTFKDIPIMYHFRIGTHGPNSGGLTHPFPVSMDFEKLSALDLYTDVAVAHNGIIHSVTPKIGWSDTQQYIADVLRPLYGLATNFYREPALQLLIKNTINGSRFVFLDKHGDFTLIGNWETSDDTDLEGIKFSNLNHEGWYSYYRNYSSGRKGGWSNNNYSSGYFDKYEQEEVSVLPIGTRIYNTKALDGQFQPKPGATFTQVTEHNEGLFFVDKYGDIYTFNTTLEMAYRSGYYDFAFVPVKDEKSDDIIYVLANSDDTGNDKIFVKVSDYRPKSNYATRTKKK